MFRGIGGIDPVIRGCRIVRLGYHEGVVYRARVLQDVVQNRLRTRVDVPVIGRKQGSPECDEINYPGFDGDCLLGHPCHQ